MFSFPEPVVPVDPAGLVVLPHFTGQPAGPCLSYLAWLVHQAGFPTALCDLSGGKGAVSADHLAGRLASATGSLRDHAGLSRAPLAYLAAGTAAAAVLTAAAADSCAAQTVVCYGGRLD